MQDFQEQLQKMKSQPGFIAALDQSGGSTPNALRAYGIKGDAWVNEEEMFALVHLTQSEEGREFFEVAKSQGLKAAFKWRDARFAPAAA